MIMARNGAICRKLDVIMNESLKPGEKQHMHFGRAWRWYLGQSDKLPGKSR
jgi:hypothetical protein